MYPNSAVYTPLPFPSLPFPRFLFGRVIHVDRVTHMVKGIKGGPRKSTHFALEAQRCSRPDGNLWRKTSKVQRKVPTASPIAGTFLWAKDVVDPIVIYGEKP